TLALPLFTKTIESAKAQEAIAALQQIRAGERVYFLKENTFWPCAGITDINNYLRLFLETKSDRNWDYSVTTTPPSDLFTATATRKTGPYQNGKIKINQDGTLTPDGWPLPLH
ncbi:MAG: hypothetical protein V1662_05980, partial [Candidatus Omnitrophota bacterium]